VNSGPRVLQQAPDGSCRWVTEAFTGTAYAVRRDLFLLLGAFREILVHQGEEGDFCIRMLDAGYFVRLGSADPILHYESPCRDRARMDFYGPRNLILHCWQNVPFPYLPAHLLVTTGKALLHGASPTRLGGIASGYGLLLRTERDPVRGRTYRLFRLLRSRGALDLDQVAGRR